MQESRPIIFGEVLFDCFPDGNRVLGGAPFNVAWHLQGLGMNPAFISRIGKDNEGEIVIDKMRAWGMETEWVQQDGHHPTGQVIVTLNKGQPTFDIIPDQAYDFIRFEPIKPLLDSTTSSLLYHGSLISRQDVSHDTLTKICTSTNSPRFVDLNLRAPWYTQKTISDTIHGARWLKLNHEELAIVSSTQASSIDTLRDDAIKLGAQHKLDLLIITCGEQDTLFVSQDHCEIIPTRKVANIVDTVGAGDAFSAITIYGLLHHWPLKQTLTRAADFAANVCTIRGATTADKDFYNAQLARWH
jgi:fructokinase